MFGLSVKGSMFVNLSLEGSAYTAIRVPADETLKLRAYLTAPGSSEPARLEETDVRLWIEDLGTGKRTFKDTVFNGKGSGQ